MKLKQKKIIYKNICVLLTLQFKVE